MSQTFVACIPWMIKPVGPPMLWRLDKQGVGSDIDSKRFGGLVELDMYVTSSRGSSWPGSTVWVMVENFCRRLQ
jgi:hypothetical protein